MPYFGIEQKGWRKSWCLPVDGPPRLRSAMSGPAHESLNLRVSPRLNSYTCTADSRVTNYCFNISSHQNPGSYIPMSIIPQQSQLCYECFCLHHEQNNQWQPTSWRKCIGFNNILTNLPENISTLKQNSTQHDAWHNRDIEVNYRQLRNAIAC